jgi:hypothetical protein
MFDHDPLCLSWYPNLIKVENCRYCDVIAKVRAQYENGKPSDNRP